MVPKFYRLVFRSFNRCSLFPLDPVQLTVQGGDAFIKVKSEYVDMKRFLVPFCSQFTNESHPVYRYGSPGDSYSVVQLAYRASQSCDHEMVGTFSWR